MCHAGTDAKSLREMKKYYNTRRPVYDPFREDGTGL